MKTLRVLFTLLLFTGLTYSAQAQNYSSAIGLRLGVPVSASFKTFVSDNAAVEAFVGYRSRKFLGFGWTQINITGLFEIHNDLGADGLQWYYGGGAGAYIFSFDDGFNFDGDDDGSFALGISGVIGLEYTLPTAPLTISADWLPTFFVNGFGSGFGAGYGALSVRYIISE